MQYLQIMPMKYILKEIIKTTCKTIWDGKRFDFYEWKIHY